MQILRVKVIDILAGSTCPGDTLSFPDEHLKEERTSAGPKTPLSLTML